MAPVVAEVAFENRNTFAVAKLNIKNARETLKKYPIIGTPTYYIFKDGENVGRRFGGVMPKAQLLQRILSVIE